MSRRGGLWLWFALLLMALIAVCGRIVIELRMDAQRQREETEYHRLAQVATATAMPMPLATLPPPWATPGLVAAASLVSPAPAQQRLVDFEYLRRINPNVVAWLRIPDTRIDYPVAQAVDNAYYLTHAFDGAESISGSLFLDCAAAKDFTDQHAIIYGHSMRNGGMFAKLSLFLDRRYLLKHPNAYLYLPEKTYRLRLFAVSEVAEDGTLRQFAFTDVQEWRAYWRQIRANAKWSDDYVPAAEDRLLSLVTCTQEEDQRLVLFYRMNLRQ